MPRQLEALWVAILVQVLGRIGDGIWHLNRADLEGPANRLEAHFVLWVGVLMTLAGWALRTDGAPERKIHCFVFGYQKDTTFTESRDATITTFSELVNELRDECRQYAQVLEAQRTDEPLSLDDGFDAGDR